jgi:bacterioferritin
MRDRLTAMFHSGPAAVAAVVHYGTETRMKGKPEIIDALNDVLTGELTAINQYFLHARMCQNWGYKRLWEKVRAESIDEMKHADKLIERVLYLEGLPNVQRLGKVNIGQTVPEQLKVDLDLEREALQKLNKAIELCRNLGDNGTKDLFQEILDAEEDHVDWLETQLELIKQVGEANYLAQQMHD